jgi:prepilin-type N-terminal cleavage/methylation domain-containing protein
MGLTVCVPTPHTSHVTTITMTMRTQTKLSAAFTLIELLIVVTIIAVLASIALPAFIGVKERGDQTKDLSNAKQVALGLRQFAIDNNGQYPSKHPAVDYSDAAATALATGDFSNDAFWWLFPEGGQQGYLQSEQIFAVAGSAYTKGNPDNRLDATNAAARAETLKAGENNYAYVSGLTDTSNPTFPILADGFTTTIGTYDSNKSNVGGVWAAKKAVIAFCDGSGQIVKVDPTTKQVQRIPTAGGAKVNMFATDTDWIQTGGSNPVLNPQPPPP